MAVIPSVTLATGVVVMGGDSWSEGHEFECQLFKLDGHFSQ